MTMRIKPKYQHYRHKLVKFSKQLTIYCLLAVAVLGFSPQTFKTRTTIIGTAGLQIFGVVPPTYFAKGGK